MNCVRRHLSAIKGGRLAAACRPARVLNLVLSDVPGDDPIDIASGPTVPDPTTCADALEILRRYDIDVPARVRALLESGEGETLKPGDPRLPAIETRLVATPQMALEAAARHDDAEFFRDERGLAFAADAGGVYERVGAAFVLHFGVYGIHGGAGDGGDDGAFFADHAI